MCNSHIFESSKCSYQEYIVFKKSYHASCSFRLLCCILRRFKNGNSVCIQHQLLLILPLPPLCRGAALKRNTLGMHQNMSHKENKYSFYQNSIPNIPCVPSRRKCLFWNLGGNLPLCPRSCCISAIGVDHRGGPSLIIRLCLIGKKNPENQQSWVVCKNMAWMRRVRQSTTFP